MSDPAGLIAQAQKRMQSSSSFFSSITGSSSAKQEEAADLYKRAANQYKIRKEWKPAGDCFVEAARIHEQLQVMHEIAQAYNEAATCYKKVDQDAYVSALQSVVRVYSDMGRFAMAAKAVMSLAETFETQICDLPKAAEFYEQAADLYKTEENTSGTNKASLKVAHLAAQMEDYEKAFEMFEEVASGMVDSNLLKWSAKEYYLKAGLCRLCNDLVDAQQRIETYERQFAGFRDTREQRLLQDLSAALEEGDVDKYTAHVQEYDAVSPLDPWYTTILLRIKKTIDNDDLL
eukprot:m.15523 g.15523  ORF g.15523 m.15523 type:complete len:289 (+) comp5042_c0_seq1:319-1185(+)